MPLSNHQLYQPSVVSSLANVCQRVGHLNALTADQLMQSDERLTERVASSLQFDDVPVELAERLTDLYLQPSASNQLVSEKELKQAHRELLGESPAAGQYRSTGMGFYRNNKLVHMTVAANQINKQLQQLLLSLNDREHHPLLRALNFLYEFEYLQPFSTANGCIGRLWCMRLLSNWQPVLAHLPFEPLLLAQQERYYQCLKQAIANNETTLIMAYLLQIIEDGIERLIDSVEQRPNLLTAESSEKIAADNSDFGVQQGSEKLSTREKIVHLLTLQPRWSAARVADVVGISSRAVEKHISRLKDEGILIREGSARAGRWRVAKGGYQQLSLPEY